MVTEIKTDIIDYIENHEGKDSSLILIHQANCFNTLSSARGLARVLGTKYPQIGIVEEHTKKGDKSKLGTFTYAKAKPNVWIFNAYGQYNYGNANRTGIVYTHYNALEKAVRAVKEYVEENEISNPVYCIPKFIGQDLAGGDPEVIQPMLKQVFESDELVLFYN